MQPTGLDKFDDIDIDAFFEAKAKLTGKLSEASKKAAYERKKESERLRNLDKSRAGRNIAPLPEIVNPARRAAACLSLRVFCETYLASVFNLEWSKDQLRVIDKIQSAIETGALRCFAMPRGSGKTRLTAAGAIWAVLTGRCKNVLIAAATNPMAKKIFKLYIKSEFIDNPLILEDFPEAVYPIWKLERNLSRANGQHIDGIPTAIGITVDGLTLPTVEGSACSGSTITCAGITSGNLRGGRYDLILVDDPQTHASSKSQLQCEERERILLSDILACAFPGKPLTCLMSVTIIRGGDIADKFSDPAVFPQWMGERTKMLDSMPTNEKLWDEYHEIQVVRQRIGDTTPAKENAFYEQNRESMDLGASAAWPARFKPTELSAIQHAMNLKFEFGEEAFASEYQNAPLALTTESTVMVDERTLLDKIEPNRPRGTVPNNADVLTAMIDCHDKLLYYSVGAFKQDGFTGGVVEYGTYPDQKRSYFTLNNAKISLGMKCQLAGKDGALLAGLVQLIDDLCSRVYKTESGMEMRIRRIHVDEGWNTQIVHQAIRQCKYPALVMPSKGVGITASKIPFSEYTKHAGDKVGLDWRVPGAKGTKLLRSIHVDTNSWKTRLMNMLATPLGDKGNLSLPAAKDGHRILIEHILSEYSVSTFGRGRTVNEFRARPDGGDKHLLDCLVGMIVAASCEGCNTINVQPQVRKARQRQRVTYCGDKSPTPTAAPAAIPVPAATTASAPPARGQTPQRRQRRKVRYF